MFNRQSLHAIIGLSAASLPSLLPLHAIADTVPLDNAGWYASGVISVTSFVQGGGPDVTLLGVRPVTLYGSTDYGRGLSLGLIAGREVVIGDENKKHYRVEGEYWLSQFQRNTVKIGRFSVPSNDVIHAQALFINGLIRLGATENTRLWAGLGLGYAGGKIPAINTSDGCACLGADKASGLALRLKTQGEYLISNKTSLVAEFGYVRLPSSPAVNMSSKTRYGAIYLPQFGIGFRSRF